MVELSAIDLLDVWEQGRRQPPLLQPLSLLSAAFPEPTPEALAALSIGQRDGLLLSLREAVFGPELVSVTGCPGCGERVELNFTVSDIRVPRRPDDEAAAEQQLSAAGYEVHFRLPSSLDLLAVADHDESEARSSLLQRCLLAAEHNGDEKTAADLPPPVVEAITRRMAAVDAQAEVRLELACPVCEHGWVATFDIARFLWEEVDAWARRTLREIHLLASAYGWRETEILKLSAWRRQAYIDLLLEQ